MRARDSDLRETEQVLDLVETLPHGKIAGSLPHRPVVISATGARPAPAAPEQRQTPESKLNAFSHTASSASSFAFPTRRNSKSEANRLGTTDGTVGGALTSCGRLRLLQLPTRSLAGQSASPSHVVHAKRRFHSRRSAHRDHQHLFRDGQRPRSPCFRVVGL